MDWEHVYKDVRAAFSEGLASDALTNAWHYATIRQKAPDARRPLALRAAVNLARGWAQWGFYEPLYREDPLGHRDPVAPPTVAPLDPVAVREVMARIGRAFRELSLPDRHWIAYKTLRPDLIAKEVAMVCGITTEALRKRRERALKKLGAALASHLALPRAPRQTAKAAHLYLKLLSTGDLRALLTVA